MKIDYRSGDKPNFGDDLNTWLWPKLMPQCLSETDGIHFLGIGTVLKQKRFTEKLKHARKIVIFSSGCWDTQIPEVDPRWRVYGVRGPRTARKLGLGPDSVIGDGAYLLSTQSLPIQPRTTTVGFVPHHRSEDYVNWQAVCDAAGVRFITARQPVESFVHAVSGCGTLIAEAMHGAIAADLLRIPWMPVRFAPNFNEDKWYDWAEALNLEISFAQLPMVYQSGMPLGRRLSNRAKSQLNRLGMGPEKWGKLPVASGNVLENTQALVDELGAIAYRPQAQLSTDHDLERISCRLRLSLERLIDDYGKGVI